MSKKTIMFTGGGSTGHVALNIELIPKFLDEKWTVEYVGSYDGIEKQLILKMNDVIYNSISTGKLRRYFDVENIKDVKRTLTGVLQAYKLIKAKKPNVIFAKGGFVSFPVVIGAWLNKVPVILHESDVTPGLANKLCMPFVSFVCITFNETKKYIRSTKTVYLGPIIRKSLNKGNPERGYSLCRFKRTKPVLLIMGGSLGAKKINTEVRACLNTLLKHFNIVHICGKGQLVETIIKDGYAQFEYVDTELADIMAISDIVLSRAGSNSIHEFLFFQKPMILVPLPKGSSRGEQITNAELFKKNGYCEVIYDNDLTEKTLINTVNKVFNNRFYYIENMKKFRFEDSLDKLFELIVQTANKKR
ncbi:undecaprenyldiphospho-muramoylpentapeptide beta-N-acetylglucosaminyltransferase [Lutispora sp.]|mgnify:CR=1 FL=1|uniref:undecaprenyldiphospho-muramoylpentapeptide beta-N-acetylglucosaminyltransferase n=1 Tax=Lutispora sp. TaxID=2828727 RepID=UPI003564F8AC